MATPFTMDFKDFEKHFKKLVEKSAPEELKKGLFRGASEMLLDADKEAPCAPKDKGDLRGSKTVQEPKEKGSEIYVEAGYNIIYAARLHEMEKTPQVKEHWTFPGSGTKWLEDKLVKYKEKYMKIVASYLEKLLA